MAQAHDEEQDEKCTRRAQPEIQRGTILIILGISESLAGNSVWNEPHHSAMPQCKEHPLNEEPDVEQSPVRPNSIQRRVRHTTASKAKYTITWMRVTFNVKARHPLEAKYVSSLQNRNALLSYGRLSRCEPEEVQYHRRSDQRGPV